MREGSAPHSSTWSISAGLAQSNPHPGVLASTRTTSQFGLHLTAAEYITHAGMCVKALSKEKCHYVAMLTLQAAGAPKPGFSTWIFCFRLSGLCSPKVGEFNYLLGAFRQPAARSIESFSTGRAKSRDDRVVFATRPHKAGSTVVQTALRREEDKAQSTLPSARTAGCQQCGVGLIHAMPTRMCACGEIHGSHRKTA